MAFPSLFPTGRGDPNGLFVNSKEKSDLLKIRHLIKYAEEVIENGQKRFVSRFAQHPRFILWAHNVFFRHRTISQANIYLKQNPGDANKTIEEIKKMLTEKTSTNLINNVRRYMANIPGTPSYWYNVSQELNAIIESKGPPHGFFTFSFADRYINHSISYKFFYVQSLIVLFLLNRYDPALKEFLFLPLDASQDRVDQCLLENPQHVNWFFIHKMSVIKNVWIEAILKGHTDNGGWWWYRFEWQFRGVIHAHGLVKIGGNAPDTYELADQAIERQRLLDLKKTEYTEKEIESMKLGETAEKIICEFHDKLVCTDSLIKYTDWLPPSEDIPPRPRPMRFKSSDIKNTKKHKKIDKIDLTFMLQRHQCKAGLCLKTYDGVQSCRLKYPKPLSTETKLEITR